MKIIITALYLEAQPLIHHFGLKKDTDSPPIPLYRGGDICLAVSGTGRVKTAVATTWLFGRCGSLSEAVACNFGLCGCADAEVPVGELFLINKITEAVTGRDFYPDILLKHDLPEHSLTTYDRAVSKGQGRQECDALIDMEASAFYGAAATFLSPERIFCLKLVSDHLENKSLKKDCLRPLIEAKIPFLEALLRASDTLISVKRSDLEPPDYAILSELQHTLHLTVTQQHQLRYWARHYIIRSRTNLNLLRPYLSKTVKSKAERNRFLNAIKRELQAK